jgi:hypothetical protein
MLAGHSCTTTPSEGGPVFLWNTLGTIKLWSSSWGLWGRTRCLYKCSWTWWRWPQEMAKWWCWPLMEPFLPWAMEAGPAGPGAWIICQPLWSTGPQMTQSHPPACDAQVQGKRHHERFLGVLSDIISLWTFPMGVTYMALTSFITINLEFPGTGINQVSYPRTDAF